MLYTYFHHSRRPQNIGNQRDTCMQFSLSSLVQNSATTFLPSPSTTSNLTQPQLRHTYVQTIFHPSIHPSSFFFLLSLQLSLLRGHRRAHHVPDITRRLVEVERHALAAEVLADDVELDAVLVDHVGDSAEKNKKSVKNNSANTRKCGQKLTPNRHLRLGTSRNRCSIQSSIAKKK